MGSGTAWSSYTPTYANLTIGNATVTARYIQVGKTVHYRGEVVLGSTTSVGSSPTITLPVTSSSTGYSAPSSNYFHFIGTGGFYRVGIGIYFLRYAWASTTTMAPLGERIDATYASSATVTSTVPATWTSGDYFAWYVVYEAA